MKSLDPIMAGAAADYPVQTWLRGGASKAAYASGSGDTLVGSVYQGSTPAAIFNPTVVWYTASSTQTGYLEGQILISITNAQAALLVPRGAYVVVVQWTPASSSSKTAPIARMILPVEGTTPP
jgi:hypothetical protein